MASAAQFTAGSYPVHLQGSPAGSETHTVGGSTTIGCGNSFTGILGAATSAITLAPGPANCGTGAKGEGEPILYTMNGCNYVFNVTGGGAGDHASGTYSIVCPAGKVIEAHQYLNEHAESTGTTNCTITKGAQAGSGSVTYTSATAAGHVVIEGAIGLTSTLHGMCTFGFTLNRNDTYHVNMTVKGTAGQALHVG